MSLALGAARPRLLLAAACRSCQCNSTWAPSRQRDASSLWKQTWRSSAPRSLTPSHGRSFASSPSTLSRQSKDKTTYLDYGKTRRALLSGQDPSQQRPIEADRNAGVRAKRDLRFALRATYLKRLAAALSATPAHPDEIERHFYAFCEQHSVCTGGKNDTIPAVLLLSPRQLARMLSVWAAPPGMADVLEAEDIRSDTSTSELARSEAQASLERTLERGAKRATKRCMALLEMLRAALQTKTSLKNDPLRIVEQSQSLLQDILLEPHLGPRPASAKSSALLLDRVLHLVLNRSRSISNIHLSEAMQIVRLVLPPPVRDVEDEAALTPRERHQRAQRERFQRSISKRTYKMLLTAVARTVPRAGAELSGFWPQRSHFAPREAQWRIAELHRCLRALAPGGEAPANVQAETTPEEQTVPMALRKRRTSKAAPPAVLEAPRRDAFDVLEALLEPARTFEWTTDNALAVLSALCSDMSAQAKAAASACVPERDRTPDTSIYSALLTFAMRSLTLDAVPLVVARACERRQADVTLFNTFLAQLPSLHPKQRDDGTSEQDPPLLSSGDRSLGSDTAEQEITITRLIYESMRNNLVSLELRQLQGKPDKRQHHYADLDDPLSAFVMAGAESWAESDPYALHSPVSLPEAPPSLAEQQMRLVLGIRRLPQTVVPNAQTYALLVKCLSWHGDLQGAMAIIEDMVQTPIDAGYAARDPDFDFRPCHALTQQSEETFLPGLDIYDSLFRGFARFSVPGRLDFLNEYALSNSRWQFDEGELSDWNVHSFGEVFESFLQLSPRKAPRRADWIDPYDGDAERRYVPRRAIDVGTVAPSVNQFFWLLTALRRVSGDHAQWTLMQWSRAWVKFSGVPWEGLAREIEAERRHNPRWQVALPLPAGKRPPTHIGATDWNGDEGEERKEQLESLRFGQAEDLGSAEHSAQIRGTGSGVKGGGARQSVRVDVAQRVMRYTSGERAMWMDTRLLQPDPDPSHTVGSSAWAAVALRQQEQEEQQQIREQEEGLQEQQHDRWANQRGAPPHQQQAARGWVSAQLNARLARTLLFLRQQL